MQETAAAGVPCSGTVICLTVHKHGQDPCTAQTGMERKYSMCQKCQKKTAWFGHKGKQTHCQGCSSQDMLSIQPNRKFKRYLTKPQAPRPMGIDFHYTRCKRDRLHTAMTMPFHARGAHVGAHESSWFDKLGVFRRTRLVLSLPRNTAFAHLRTHVFLQEESSKSVSPAGHTTKPARV